METFEKKPQLLSKNIFSLDYNSYGRMSIGNDGNKVENVGKLNPSDVKDKFQMDNYCIKMS